MHACPSSEELQNFLDQGFGADYIARILAHVEDCYLCQQALERLTVGISAIEDGLVPAALSSEFDATIDLAGTEIVGQGDQPPPANLNGFGPLGAQTDVCEPAGEIGENTEPDPSLATGPGFEGVYSGRTVTAVGAPESTADGPETDGSKSREPDPRAHGQTRNPSDWPIIPGYEILGALGEGGMGVVYKANHLELKRHVALKMIRGGSQPRANLLARFRTEAEAVARLRHPNVLQIYNIGEAGGLPFLALELLEGGSLGDSLAGEPQPARQAAELAMTLARAVHVAHQAGIVHRDLKPSNVLYTFGGVPKITDFGLAKLIDSDDGHTESGQVMGSPSYMAPEQARGHSRNVGPAADVYALGAILYEMLTGRPPFKGETPMETMRQVVDLDPVAPSQLVPRVPRDLETITLKCLSKEPARRYSSAQALADDLYRYLHGQVIQARPTPAWERAAKWSRRHKLAAASLVAGIMLVTGGIVFAFAYQRHLNLLALRETNAAFADEITGNGLIDGSRNLTSHGDLTRAKIELAGFQRKILENTRLKGLSGRLDAAIKSVDAKLAEREARDKRLGVERDQRDRLAKFRELRKESNVHGIQLTGLDLATSQDRLRRAARAALALYAAPKSGDFWALDVRSAGLSQSDQAEVEEGCYGLLLSLSDVEQTPEEGLRRLDEAARLRPKSTTAYHLLRAACLARARRNDEARRERESAERTPLGTADDHYLVGRESYNRGDDRNAIRSFYAVLQFQPDHFWARCFWSVCCLQLEQFSDAKTGLTACLDREPHQAWLFVLRGFSSYQLGLRAQTRLERSPPLEWPMLRSEADIQLDAAAADYARAFKLIEDDARDELRYPLLVNRGLLELEREDFARAEADLRAAIDLDARRLEALLALTQVYLKQAKPGAALEELSRAISLDPLRSALYRGRADVELTRQNLTDAQRSSALRDLQKSISLERPGSRDLAADHAKVARLLALEHRDADALAACNSAIGIAGDLEDAHRLRIDLLLRLKQYADVDVARFEEVDDSCSALIAQGGPSSTLYEVRALARSELKYFPGAISDLTFAIASRPEHAPLLCQRGWLYFLVDAPRLAIHDFDAAIDLDRTCAEAYNGRGAARVRFLEYREAIEDARTALSLGTPASRLYYDAARVYALAADAVAAEARKMGGESPRLKAQYQDRAAGLLRLALKQMPSTQRAEFVRRVIEQDPSLRPLRRQIRFQEIWSPSASSASSGSPAP